MAIVAVIMSVNFAACSDDDDEGEVASLIEIFLLLHRHRHYMQQS